MKWNRCGEPTREGVKIRIKRVRCRWQGANSTLGARRGRSLGDMRAGPVRLLPARTHFLGRRPASRRQPLLLLPRGEGHHRGTAALARLLADFGADCGQRGEVLDAQRREPRGHLLLGRIAFCIGDLRPVFGNQERTGGGPLLRRVPCDFALRLGALGGVRRAQPEGCFIFGLVRQKGSASRLLGKPLYRSST